MPLTTGQLLAVRSDRILRNLRTLWYVRFPLLLIAMLIGFAPVSLLLFPKLFSSALVATSWQQVATLVYICMIAATTAMIQTATILEIGSDWLRDKRIKKSLIFKTLSEISKPRGQEPPAPLWRWEAIPTLILLVAGLTLPCICALQSLENKADTSYSKEAFTDEVVATYPTTLLGFVVGLFAVYLTLQAIAILQSLFEASYENTRNFKHHPVTPISYLRFHGKFPTKDLIQTRFWKNHHEVFQWGLFVLVIYATVFLTTFTKPIEPDHYYSSAFYLVLLMIIWETAFSVTAFYFDRYRVPAILIFLLGLFFVQLALPYQHYFKTMPGAQENIGLSKNEKSGQNQRRSRNSHNEPSYKIIVVAPGGGIHAAAWTGTVLAGLHEEFGRQFEDSLYLISAVSGGSVGTMFYLDHFEALVANNLGKGDQAKNDNNTDTRGNSYRKQKYDNNLKSVRRRSSTSSLESLFWGLTYPDTLRFVLNRWIPNDRGSVQESLWRTRLDRELNDDGPTLLDWEKEAVAGNMPYVVFNATETETGRRVLFSTHPNVSSAVPNGNQTAQWKPKHFLELSNSKVDIPITTAVRLSATFPYVSPASRPGATAHINLGHVVDGGYTDNEGLLTAIEVIDYLQTKAQNQKTQEKIILVRIDHIPKTEELDDAEESTMQETNGFKYASLGPIFAAYNVRDSSQKERGEIELELLRKRLNTEPSAPKLFEVTIRFRSNDNLVSPPLNWKLLPNQRTAYEASWKDLVEDADHKKHVRSGDHGKDTISEGLSTLRRLLTSP